MTAPALSSCDQRIGERVGVLPVVWTCVQRAGVVSPELEREPEHDAADHRRAFVLPQRQLLLDVPNLPNATVFLRGARSPRRLRPVRACGGGGDEPRRLWVGPSTATFGWQCRRPPPLGGRATGRRRGLRHRLCYKRSRGHERSWQRQAVLLPVPHPQREQLLPTLGVVGRQPGCAHPDSRAAAPAAARTASCTAATAVAPVAIAVAAINFVFVVVAFIFPHRGERSALLRAILVLAVWSVGLCCGIWRCWRQLVLPWHVLEYLVSLQQLPRRERADRTDDWRRVWGSRPQRSEWR